jgi:DNA repair exonuclease SbcCD ATPase subunit
MKVNQIRIQQVLCGAAIAAVLAAVITTGCSKPAPKGPSYAEALAIYNDEVQALDRLKEQRSKLQQQLDSPSPTSNLDAAAQLLGNTADLSKEISGAIKDLAGPNSPVGGEEAQRRQDELIGSVTDQIEQAKAKQQQNTEEWEAKKEKIAAKIAELKKQIAEQKGRVERAKADKDAAEASQR